MIRPPSNSTCAPGSGKKPVILYLHDNGGCAEPTGRGAGRLSLGGRSKYGTGAKPGM